MQTLKIKYLRGIIVARKWANTENGERTICVLGTIYAVIAIGSAALLTCGCLMHYAGIIE